MTRDEIIRMARDACYDLRSDAGTVAYVFTYLQLERFAALVAAPLEAKVEALEKGAARYRWLREHVYIDTDKRLRIARTYLIQSGTDTTAEMLDAAIDAARGKT